MKKTILTIIVCLCSALLSAAQFKYTERQSISYGDAPDPNYGITIRGTNGLYLEGNVAKIIAEPSHSYCYLYASDWAIYFYDDDAYCYNDIYAMDVRTSANGEIYDGVIGGDEAMATIRTLTPVSYNVEAKTSMRSQSEDNQQTQIGLTSQNIQQAIPKAINVDPEGNATIDYIRLLPITLGAVGNLKDRIEANQAKLNRLKSTLNLLSVNTTVQ